MHKYLRIQCWLNTSLHLDCAVGAGFLRCVGNVLLLSAFGYLDVFFVRFLSFMVPLPFFPFYFFITYILSVKFYFVIFITPVALCPVLGSPAQERNGAREESPAKWHEDDGLDHISCEERLREPGFFILEKRRLGVISSMCINTEGRAQRQGSQALFSKAQWQHRGSGHILKPRRFPLNRGSTFLLLIEHWHGLPKEFDKSPSLDIFKNCLDMVLGSWLWVALCWAGEVKPYDLQSGLPTSVALSS